jgi:predicted MPP superfamily phosphohydrolase
VQFRTVTVRIPGLAPELEGLRIAHLSDFHLGAPSPGARAVARAFAWVAARRPDLVLITGDLLTRPRGEPALRRLVETLDAPAVAILGNHDVAIARDPLARRSALRDLAPVRLLRDESETLELRGRRVYVAGTSPRTEFGRRIRRRQPSTLAGTGDLRILLVHSPRTADLVEPGGFDLVLAGHMHDGQICLPFPGGKIRLAHPKARWHAGLYRIAAGPMHVSPGLGTTFVPFRFFARPEATELLLQSG